MWQGSRQRKSRFSFRNGVKRRSSQKAPLTGRSRLKQERIKKRFLHGVGAVSALVLIVAGLSFASFGNALSLKELHIEGNNLIAAEALEARSWQFTAGAYFGLFSKQNIFLFPAGDLENLLFFEFPRAEEVSVKRNIFTRAVQIKVAERVPYALWCKVTTLPSEDSEEGLLVRERCFLADRLGFLFDEGTGQETLIKIYNGIKHPDGAMLRKQITPTYFRDVVSLLSGLQALNLDITSVTFREDEAEVIVAPGWKLLITFAKDVSAVPLNLATILDENELGSKLNQLEYVDLRFDDRVYYRLIDGSEG